VKNIVLGLLCISATLVFSGCGTTNDDNIAKDIKTVNIIDFKNIKENTEETVSEEVSKTEENNESAFTQQDLDDVETVDNAILTLRESDEFSNSSAEDRKYMLNDLLNQLQNNALIHNLQCDDSSTDEMDVVFSFEYKCGILGGASVRLDDEYYWGDEPIN